MYICIIYMLYVCLYEYNLLNLLNIIYTLLIVFINFQYTYIIFYAHLQTKYFY